VYDPLDPVPSRGGPLCCTGNPRDAAGTADQADVEKREDVLVFTSAPLASDLRIAGPLKLTLTFSSDAPDTDLVARLVDVRPDGLATNIQEGALRLRYREGAAARLMTAGERYLVVLDLRSIAYRLARGHKLRLDVTSSSFPRLERNLNTGADNGRETAPRRATNYLHYGPDAPAFIELPVLEELRAAG
jgi:putative CocE/NonD family hydrolase